MNDARSIKRHKEFAVYKLNDLGMSYAVEIRDLFDNLLDRIETICVAESRELSIARTKLEEASFFAKKAMAHNQENRQ